MAKCLGRLIHIFHRKRLAQRRQAQRHVKRGETPPHFFGRFCAHFQNRFAVMLFLPCFEQSGIFLLLCGRSPAVPVKFNVFLLIERACQFWSIYRSSCHGFSIVPDSAKGLRMNQTMPPWMSSWISTRNPDRPEKEIAQSSNRTAGSGGQKKTIDSKSHAKERLRLPAAWLFGLIG